MHHAPAIPESPPLPRSVYALRPPRARARPAPLAVAPAPPLSRRTRRTVHIHLPPSEHCDAPAFSSAPASASAGKADSTSTSPYPVSTSAPPRSRDSPVSHQCPPLPPSDPSRTTLRAPFHPVLLVPRTPSPYNSGLPAPPKQQCCPGSPPIHSIDPQCTYPCPPSPFSNPLPISAPTVTRHHTLHRTRHHRLHRAFSPILSMSSRRLTQRRAAWLACWRRTTRLRCRCTRAMFAGPRYGHPLGPLRSA